MFKQLVGSLVLASSLFACQSATQTKVADPSHPIAVSAPKQLDRENVRGALAARRQAMYQRFLAYREGRIYPVATEGSGMQHVWIDQVGNLCAAATLISQDLGRDQAVAVINGNNSIALAMVHAGPLADWMLTSGLTHQEIVAIQEPGFVDQQYDPAIVEPQPQRIAEIDRLYNTYIDVERQLLSLWDENLDTATDALMTRPDLARQLLSGS